MDGWRLQNSRTDGWKVCTHSEAAGEAEPARRGEPAGAVDGRVGVGVEVHAGPTRPVEDGAAAACAARSEAALKEMWQVILLESMGHKHLSMWHLRQWIRHTIDYTVYSTVNEDRVSLK